MEPKPFKRILFPKYTNNKQVSLDVEQSNFGKKRYFKMSSKVITIKVIIGKQRDVKLSSDSAHLNYVQNENKNNRTISVGGTIRTLIGFVIPGSDMKRGRHSMKNIFSVYNARKGQNNKSFLGTLCDIKTLCNLISSTQLGAQKTFPFLQTQKDVNETC